VSCYLPYSAACAITLSGLLCDILPLHACWREEDSSLSLLFVLHAFVLVRHSCGTAFMLG